MVVRSSEFGLKGLRLFGVAIGCGLSLLSLGTPVLAQAVEPGLQSSAWQSETSANRLITDLNLALKNPELPPLGGADLYLPGEPGVALIVRLSKRRVYVYQGDKELASYPVAVGKSGWQTPIGTYQVFEKELNPIFKSFKSGRIVPPGPLNPLGVRWIGIWTDGKTRLGFHGTNEPELIGQAVSHGCIRMLNKDVTALYEKVRVGTPVTVKP
jgi:hypothetical protein